MKPAQAHGHAFDGQIAIEAYQLLVEIEAAIVPGRGRDKFEIIFAGVTRDRSCRGHDQPRSRSWMISWSSSPRNPQRKPWPSAAELAISKLNEASLRRGVEARARGLKRPVPVPTVQGMPWFRFTGLVIALAMLLAPVSMIGGAHATSAGGLELAQPDHCAGMPAETPEAPDSSTHCFVACSAVAPSAALMVARVPPVAEVAIGKILAGPSGRSPTADPPPPRFS